MTMYQGMQQQPVSGNYYTNANPYSGPQYQQRLMPMEQAQTPYPPIQTGSFLKGRPVVSLEEARAAQIDLDGSIYIFTDIGNKKIYTKQFNLDGTATLNTYTLVEGDNGAQSDYITRNEFNQALAQIQALLNNKEIEKRPVTTASNF